MRQAALNREEFSPANASFDLKKEMEDLDNHLLGIQKKQTAKNKNKGMNPFSQSVEN
jgi:hypothetical protein